MTRFTFLCAVGAFVASVIVSRNAVAAITIETVPVGNPGNAPDTRYFSAGRGAVDHAYSIGKYEVTAAQYAAFLNSVAKSDTYGVYHWEMATRAGIVRSGTPADYTYTVTDGWAGRPISEMNYISACRFVNWLNNGQPVGPQDLTTEDGAYALDGYTGGGYQVTRLQRKPGAVWVMPMFDEWYKAAYYKGGGTNAGYWTWPTNEIIGPSPEPPPGGTNSANAANAVGNTTAVGAYASSPGPFGTFDMGGNVQELTQYVVSASQAPYAGGWYESNVTDLRASSAWGDIDPSTWLSRTGFRVALIPEPDTIALVACALLLQQNRRKTRTI